ncbi:hypothetical protein BDP27DRAFT_1432454 [Rhodocollybia butyracea]|uniref:Fungal-type protein kinase domain-containing protein n=1 Tax=Rhodocollybia butyracea TaxID=206335 RepID=A0A9P5PAC9_9AGAR|nr:hypothetical protein BDP27DRAFT_1432454 [Rhodocollybia butyracea]
MFLIRNQVHHLSVYPHLTSVWRDAYRRPGKPSYWRVSVSCQTPLGQRMSIAGHSTQPALRPDPEETMRSELSGHTWKFPTKDLARILSAKTRKQESPPYRSGVIDQLEHYEIALDNLESELDISTRHLESLKLSVGEYPSKRESYGALTEFLNAAVHTVVDQSPGSILTPLHFHTWDKPVNDKVEHTAPLQPNLVGVFQESSLNKVYWGRPRDSDGVTIKLPVEVKDNWMELVTQAAADARSMFSTSPLRIHSVVLGFNHKTGHARFLVFHRGGLTASDPLPLLTPAGRGDFLRLLFSIFTWKTPGDAGFPIWYNDTEMSLPAVEMLGLPSLSVKFNSLLHKSTCIRGCAPHVYSLQHGVASSNTIPPASETSRTQGPSKESGDAIEASYIIDSHAQSHGVNQSDVHRLSPSPRVQAKDTPYVMKFSWGQSRGTGGFLVEPNLLHSCGGMFGVPKHVYTFIVHHMEHYPSTNHHLLPPPGHADHAYWSELLTVEKEEPEYRSLLCYVVASAGHSLEDASSLECLMRAILHAHIAYYNMCLNDYQHRDLSIGNILMVDEAIECRPFGISSPNKTQSKILKLCQALKVDKHCYGFVIDGDMAVDWRVYFQQGDITAKSGTSEFMSDRLRKYSRKQDIHSPIDDYESFYYVAQWACVFHKLSVEDSPHDPDELQELCMGLSGHYAIRGYATRIITTLNGTEKDRFGVWVAKAGPFFREWDRSLFLLRDKWKSIVELKGHNKETFRQCADLGLLSFLRLAQKHKHLFIDNI